MIFQNYYSYLAIYEPEQVLLSFIILLGFIIVINVYFENRFIVQKSIWLIEKFVEFG